jgi:hypothetical protein
VGENRSEVNFERIERLAEREARDWTYLAGSASSAGRS